MKRLLNISLKMLLITCQVHIIENNINKQTKTHVNTQVFLTYMETLWRVVSLGR